jgi:hypothetical protein
MVNDNKPQNVSIWDVPPVNSFSSLPPNLTGTLPMPISQPPPTNLAKDYYQNYRASSNIDGNLQKPAGLQLGTSAPFTKIQELVNLRNPNAFQSSQIIHDNRPALTSTSLSVLNNNSNSSKNDQNDYQSEDRFNRDSFDFCVKISGMETSTGYGDIRRFFQGKR